MTENEKLLLFAAAGVLLLSAGAVGVAVYKPRGIRLHNPGNLKELPGDKTRWLGERADDTDAIFEEFTAPEYGIRALCLVLLNYEKYYGLNTVNGLISRYAPGSENDTAAYIRFVASRLGVDPGQPFSVAARLPELARAIIQFENGQQPYTVAQINSGISMAVGAV